MSRDKLITDWIKIQAKKARVKGIVLGLSGGIDSSLAAALSVKALGPKKVLGLILPINSQAQDLKDALLLAKKLGIKTKTINLSRNYAQLIKILPKANSLSLANLKPRLRMLTLYYFANKLNYLVCGTGNKSEIMVGYYTKHGDGATDILPMGGLLKKQVYELAKRLDIPKNILAKPPSAGLWSGQTDEAEMGITYSELDNILTCLESRKKQVLSKSKVDKVKRMIARSEHKRQGAKVCRV